MAVTVTSSVQLADTGLSQAVVPEKPRLQRAEPKTINDLILQRAETIGDVGLITYPDKTGSWTEYTAKDLDGFADEAAKELSRLGLKPKAHRSTKTEVVALLGPSNLDYAIALLALSRMGFAVLFLSTRLATDAYSALLSKTECSRMLTTPGWSPTVTELQARQSLETFPLLDRSIYGHSQPRGGRFVREAELDDEPSSTAFIIHSSGSTGLPKPIFQTHSACLGNYAVGSGLRAMVTTPLFHNSGISTFFRGVTACRRTVFTDAAKPLTNAILVDAMRVMQPESFHAVPYTLKLLAESAAGIAELAKCEVVIVGGSPTPDELGDLLVSRGVNLVSHYGQTEMGQLMMSGRDRGDKEWNYLRPLPKVRPYLHFAPLGERHYECVVLDGLPTKVLSNSDEPPGSYRTRDCFTPHPTTPGAWKFSGRLDDRLTLVNGEKVLPVPIENRIRQDELVHECLVFGAERAFPGLLIIPSGAAASLTRETLLDRLSATLEAANAGAEKFSQIAREMVEVLPFDAEYPCTDKGSIIRAATYRRFAELIDAVYTRFETPDANRNGDTTRLDLASLEDYLAKLLRDRTQIKDVKPHTDFFAAGMDSLQAIMLRGHIMRQLHLGGQVLGNNAVFEHPSIRKMASHIDSMLRGTGDNRGSESQKSIDTMRELVAKYGSFSPFKAGTATPDSDVVVLTGATGSLGTHVLAQLLPLPHVRRVYCLVRAADPASALARVCSSLSSRGLGHIAPPHHLFSKIVALPSDLSRPDLGLAAHVIAQLRASVTTVIHSAWAVNFNLSVASLEPHIRGTRNLLDLCLSVPFTRPARLAFVSSVSAAAGTPPPATVNESYVENPAMAQPMGYARSKWVAEHLCRRAGEEAGMEAQVLRSGQIIGDATQGIWNATEAIPLMIRSAVSLGALPALDETPSWIPADVCARATVELSGADCPFAERPSPSRGGESRDNGIGAVYHMQNPRTFSWTANLLPALRDAGLEFEIVDKREWVRRLREGEQDAVRNPAVKLLDFFTAKYDNEDVGRKSLLFETTKAQQRSEAINGQFDVIGSGLIAKCVEQWKKCW